MMKIHEVSAKVQWMVRKTMKERPKKKWPNLKNSYARFLGMLVIYHMCSCVCDTYRMKEGDMKVM